MMLSAKDHENSTTEAEVIPIEAVLAAHASMIAARQASSDRGSLTASDTSSESIVFGSKDVIYAPTFQRASTSAQI